MIHIEDLRQRHKGKWVIYKSYMGKTEKGRIKGWNERLIFVVYKCDNNWGKYMDYTGCATDPRDLTFTDSPQEVCK